MQEQASQRAREVWRALPDPENRANAVIVREIVERELEEQAASLGEPAASTLAS